MGMWFDTAREDSPPVSHLPARQGIVIRFHEHSVPGVPAQEQHVGKHLGCAAVNSGKICHWVWISGTW